jgi:hypothetical protein
MDTSIALGQMSAAHPGSFGLTAAAEANEAEEDETEP